MSKLFLPREYLKKVLPKGFFNKKWLTRKLAPKQVLLKALITATKISGRELRAEFKKTIDFYQDKIKLLREEEAPRPVSTALNDEKLLKSRVENFLSWNEAQRLKQENKGSYYIWLPSSSTEPRPLHQLKYGKVFRIGDGEFPAEAYGCKCGALILSGDEDFLTDKQRRQIQSQKDYTPAAGRKIDKNLKR